MVRIKKKLNKNGAVFALEKLTSLLLSVIVLFFLIQVFMSFLLQGDDNLTIAKNNAKSIVSFVDYSHDHYKNKQECYTLLKLKNLENYQIDDDEKLYFYIITEDSVNILNIENLKDIQFDLDKYIKTYNKEKLNTKIHNTIKEDSLKSYFFGDKKYSLNLKYEDLSSFKRVVDGIKKIIDIVDIFSWRVKYDFVELNLKDSEYDYSDIILIIPVFGSDKSLSYTSFFLNTINLAKYIPENQNILYALNNIRVSDEYNINNLYHESYYLSYKSGDVLFPTYTIEGEQYIKNNLCEYQDFLVEKINEKFDIKNNGYNKYFEILNNYKGYIFDDYKIIFKKNKKVCMNDKNVVNCVTTFGENIKDISFEDFSNEYNVAKLQQLGIELSDDVVGKQNFFLKTEEEFIVDLLINLSEKFNIEDFKIIFFKEGIFSLNFKETFSSRNLDYNLYWFGSYKDNLFKQNCNNNLCNYFIIDKFNNVYFYDENLSIYAKFDLNFLFREKLDIEKSAKGINTIDISSFKNNNKLFFNIDNNGDLIEVDYIIKKIKKDDEFLERDYFYFINLPIKNDKNNIYTIILSSNQFNNIPLKQEVNLKNE